MIKKIKKWWANLPDKKRWVDLITASLTVPVLLTVIILNFTRLKEEKNNNTSSSEPTKEVVVVTKEPEKDVDTTPIIITASPSEEKDDKDSTSTSLCKLDPQPIEITFPSEGEVVETEPVCVIIEPTDDGYCETKWAFRTNGGVWSKYSDSPICLNNLEEGSVKLEVRTRNETSGREKTYGRNFIYQKNSTTPTPSISSTISSS